MKEKLFVFGVMLLVALVSVTTALAYWENDGVMGGAGHQSSYGGNSGMYGSNGASAGGSGMRSAHHSAGGYRSHHR